jgi:hypothetical protein
MSQVGEGTLKRWCDSSRWPVRSAKLSSAADPVNHSRRRPNLLEKTPQHEKKRLERFDLVFKFRALFERFCRKDATKWPCGSSRRPVEKRQHCRTKAFDQPFTTKGNKRPQSPDSPFFQNGVDIRLVDRESRGDLCEFTGRVDLPPARCALCREKREVGIGRDPDSPSNRKSARRRSQPS